MPPFQIPQLELEFMFPPPAVITPDFSFVQPIDVHFAQYGSRRFGPDDFFVFKAEYIPAGQSTAVLTSPYDTNVVDDGNTVSDDNNLEHDDVNPEYYSDYMYDDDDDDDDDTVINIDFDNLFNDDNSVYGDNNVEDNDMTTTAVPANEVLGRGSLFLRAPAVTMSGIYQLQLSAYICSPDSVGDSVSTNLVGRTLSPDIRVEYALTNHRDPGGHSYVRHLLRWLHRLARHEI
jgi:hypothetical protein